MCLPRCAEETCPSGSACIAGVCTPSREATAAVSIDPSTHYQSLIGFGASLAHDEELIVNRPNAQRLYDAMFAESGFDIIRARNRYEPGNTAALGSLVEIVSAASARLDRKPLLFLSGGSPPASLKANGSRGCSMAETDCTLIRNAQGGFDYAGFGEHWRNSLEAYEAAGIHPDLVSVQSNPDWLPEDTAAEACLLLPEEGVEAVTGPGGQVIEADFAGYAEAMDAVAASVSSLPSQYSFSGPEVGSAAMLEAYSRALTHVDTFAYHLDGADPSTIVAEESQVVSALSGQPAKPSIQSAMRADGLGTAILTHYALTVANSSGYIQQQFVASSFDESSAVLIGANDQTIEKLPAYHALTHFARFTDPGWVRVAATTDSAGVLASAWSSPGDDSLTIVLVNPTDEPSDVKLVIPATVPVPDTRVVRTVFSGVERSAELGVLSCERVIRLPGHAIVTIAASRE
jgi:O-glycosyl hydrolase